MEYIRVILSNTMNWCEICQDYYPALNRIKHDMSLDHINQSPKDKQKVLRLCFESSLFT